MVRWWSLSPENHVIGGTATLAAMSIPDTFLPYLGKFVFAIVTAALSSLISGYIKNRMRKS
jgi:hypothetical protein